MRVIIDTSAWIEYFQGSKEGETVNQYLKDNEIITTVVTLLELSYKADKEGWNIKDYLNFIKLKSNVVGIKESSILQFGKLYNEARKREKSFGFADAIILLTSNLEKAQILTKDLHFKGFDNAIMLK
ncbi:MAG: PIN domain-containing protein [Nanoarchaeota archaeon]|nr:PIN domain-containing protein [Nanoarchaeota archaeon]